MIHPLREFHHDPLEAGVFYGSIAAAAAAASILPGSFIELPTWLMLQAALLAVAGIMIILVAIVKHSGGWHD